MKLFKGLLVFLLLAAMPLVQWWHLGLVGMNWELKVIFLAALACGFYASGVFRNKQKQT